MHIDFTELLQLILEKYGLAGVAITFWVWTGLNVQKKIDRLTNLNNKMFGVMLALVDKRSRETLKSSGGILDERSSSDIDD